MTAASRDRKPDEERWVERYCPECGQKHMARIRPAYQFYPADEIKEPSLRTVSLAAFGLWKRMQNLMHDSVPRGWLVTGAGKAYTVKELAMIVGVTTAVVTKLLRELEENGVFKRTDEGIIYSKRMVRDEHISNVRAESGSKGGNPTLLAGEGSDLLNQPARGLVKQNGSNGGDLLNQTAKQNPTPAVAVASSSASAIKSPSSPSPAHAALSARLPESDRAALADLLSAVDNPHAWIREMEASLAGMPGHVHVTETQLGEAVRDYVTNGVHLRNPGAHHFRSYLQRAKKSERAPKGRHDNPGLQAYLNAGGGQPAERSPRPANGSNPALQGYVNALAATDRAERANSARERIERARRIAVEHPDWQREAEAEAMALLPSASSERDRQRHVLEKLIERDDAVALPETTAQTTAG